MAKPFKAVGPTPRPRRVPVVLTKPDYPAVRGVMYWDPEGRPVVIDEAGCDVYAFVWEHYGWTIKEIVL